MYYSAGQKNINIIQICLVHFQTIAVLREAVAKKYATFFQSTLHHNNGYFAQVASGFHQVLLSESSFLLKAPPVSVLLLSQYSTLQGDLTDTGNSSRTVNITICNLGFHVSSISETVMNMK